MNSAQLVSSYLNADYRSGGADRWQLRVGRRATALEARQRRADRFALLTAWNPDSVPRAALLNRRAQRALERELGVAGLRFRPAVHAASDGSWREESVLVLNAPLDLIDALARRYDQAGTLAWTRGRAVRLRLYRPAWRAEVETAPIDLRYVDWVA